MKSLRKQIEEATQAALVQVVGPEGREIDPVVRPTQDPKFGDFQSSVALGLAKRLGRKPRELAEALVAALGIDEVCEPVEIAGPGFINFRVRPQHLARMLTEVQTDPRLGVAPVEQPQRVVVDYSGPNVAKEMHVGHLRSTIIGDTIAHLLEFQGHDVLRLNHIGDWGTQFGMLIQYLRESHPEAAANPEKLEIVDLEQFYREAKKRDDEDAEFAQRARKAVVDLQSGDPQARALWTALCAESLRHAAVVYERLGIHGLQARGESFYNDMLPGVIFALEQCGLAVENQGAVCVFLEGFKNKEGDPLPMIVRKADGGYGYDTTDLAGVRQRVQDEKADRVVYVTDKRQADHFQQVFQVARRAGWVPEHVQLEHVGFGMVLGPDRKPFKTREGGTVKLIQLVDEAESRAAVVVEELSAKREAQLSPEYKREVAKVVGVGGVKYADLSHNLVTDYVFDWDTMLALEGNTAPYMLYAYARVRSIGRTAGVDLDTLPAVELQVQHETEIALAKQLLSFPEALEQVSQELRPHILAEYLYSLGRAYSRFYDREHGVRVVNAETEELRLSRLRLCDLTARTLKLGLAILGIEVVEQM